MANDSEEYNVLTPMEAELDGALRALGSPFLRRQTIEEIQMAGAVDDTDPATPNPRSFPLGRRRLEAPLSQTSYQLDADEPPLFRRRAIHGELVVDYEILFFREPPTPTPDLIDTIIRERKYICEGIDLYCVVNPLQRKDLYDANKFTKATERLLSVVIDNGRRPGEVWISGLGNDENFEPDPLYATGLRPIMAFNGKQVTSGLYAAIVNFLRDYTHLE